MLRKIIFILSFFLYQANAQERPIKVVEERNANRLSLFAVNENEQDFDVLITVEGTNFRQSKGRPRLVRVPGASKVHLKNLILQRGKQPAYTYKLEVNDSLSRRAMKKPFERIRIPPKKKIIIYITEACPTCDTLVNSLAKSNYIFSKLVLKEKPEVKKQLSGVFVAYGTPLDSLHKPIVSLGGRIYPEIEDYTQLLEKLNKE